MNDTDDIIDDSDDEEVMTAAEVYKKIEEAWINEKMSPVLEAHKSELIECMLDQLGQMTENLRRCSKNDFRLVIHKMEIDRIRYVMSSYLRIRLQKIDRLTHYVLEKHDQSDERSPLLSPEEANYARELAEQMESHFHNVALQHFPENLQKFDSKSMQTYPNLDSYVFFKVNEDTPGVLVDDITGEGREEVDLIEGGQHLMPYQTINHLLKKNAISLI